MGARNWIIGSFVIAAAAITVIAVNAYTTKEVREFTEVKSDLDSALARAESLGIPVYTEQLRRDPVPDEENAWIEINEIERLLEEHKPDRPYPIELYNEKSRDEFMSLANETITNWEPIYVQLEKLRIKEKYWPDREWEQGMALLYPDFVIVKQSVHSLLVRSRYRLYQDDIDGSLADLNLARHVSNFMSVGSSSLDVVIWLRVEGLIAKEVVKHACSAASSDHTAQLKTLLNDLLLPIDVTTAFEQDVVLYLDALRLVSDENERGNSARKEFDDMGGHSEMGKLFGSSLNATEAKKFDALAIEAACDFFENLSPEVGDYVKNDANYTKFIEHPVDWATEGFPFGFIEMMDAYGLFETYDDNGPFTLLARRELARELYEQAFHFATGFRLIENEAKWNSNKIGGAMFEATQHEDGFKITLTAPGIKPWTKEFDRP